MACAFAPIHSLPRRRKSPERSQAGRRSTETRSVASLDAASSSVISPKNLTNSYNRMMASVSQRSSPDESDQPPVIEARSTSPAAEALPETVFSPGGSGDHLDVTLSPLRVSDAVMSTPAGPNSATPRSRSSSESAISYNSVTSPVEGQDESPDGERDELTSSGAQVDLDAFERLQVPVLGYEVMEERARFTVFRMKVMRNESDSWFIFRRYTDFVRLNDQLRRLFPHFRLALPPKKWFGDNFDHTFLDDRMLGLQAFLNNVVGHRDICASGPVRVFLCLDEPPGPHESLEESRALCESMEESVYMLQQEVSERDRTISLLEERLALAHSQVDSLTHALRLEQQRRSNSRRLSEASESSLPEHDQIAHVSPARRVRHASLPRSSPESVASTNQRRDSTVSAPCVSSVQPSEEGKERNEEKKEKEEMKEEEDSVVAPVGSAMNDGITFFIGTPAASSLTEPSVSPANVGTRPKRRPMKNDFKPAAADFDE